MTIPATTRVSPIYNGNASATNFAFAYKTYAKQELQVIVSDGITPQTLVLDSDYSVVLNADQVSTPGGTITYPIVGSPLPVGKTLVVVSAVPNSQDVSLPNGGAFNAGSVETGLDRIEVQVQQFSDTLFRTIRIPAGETLSAPLPAALLRANYLLGFDSLGNPIAVAPTAGSAISLATDLANSTVLTKGAGQIGWSASLSYAAGTLGGLFTGQGAAPNFRANLLLAGNGPWANPASGDTQHLLELVNDNSPYQVFALSTYGTAGVVKENNIHCNRYGGTLAAPSNVLINSYFMSWGYRGWDGTGVLSQSMAAFQFQATENWDATHHGGRFKFELAKTGGSTTRLPAWKLYAGQTDGVVMELGDETSLPARILHASTAGFIQLHGSQDQAGAVVNLYGSAHATLPRQAQVRADVVSFQDLAGNEAVQILATNQQVLFTGKGGFGYYQGAGASVGQATNKSTNVAGDFPTIKVTMNAAALAANTAVSFSWNSNKIGADDHVVATIRGGATAGAYVAVVDAVFAGSARVSLRNMTGGSLSESVVLQLSVLKGASA